MLYWWFGDMNPLLAIVVLCPIIAIVLGICSAIGRRIIKLSVALGISFMLPLLFIASSWLTLKVNIDAWLIYGIGYSLLTWITWRVSRVIVGYKV